MEFGSAYVFYSEFTLQEFKSKGDIFFSSNLFHKSREIKKNIIKLLITCFSFITNEINFETCFGCNEVKKILENYIKSDAATR